MALVVSLRLLVTSKILVRQRISRHLAAASTKQALCGGFEIVDDSVQHLTKADKGTEIRTNRIGVEITG